MKLAIGLAEQKPRALLFLDYRHSRARIANLLGTRALGRTCLRCCSPTPISTVLREREFL